MIMQTFSQRLISVLNQKGISGYQLAKDINISRATVSNYMSGKTQPSNLILHELSNYLRVSKEWLLDGIGEMTVKGQMQRELSQFSHRQIIRYVASHAGAFSENALLRSYVDALAANRRADLLRKEYIEARNDELDLEED